MLFPEDFIKKEHFNPITKGSFMWLPKDSSLKGISIIGGDYVGHFGNGIDTFEVYISAHDDIFNDGENTGIYMYQTIDQVNTLINDYIESEIKEK